VGEMVMIPLFYLIPRCPSPSPSRSRSPSRLLPLP